MSRAKNLAHSLRDTILAHRPEMQAARRLPQPLADDLAAAGLFRLLVPRDYGGGEGTPQAFVETLETLAESDASTAWCVMIGATSGLLAAYLAPDVATSVFADPRSIVTGVFAPTGKATIEGDTYRVTGRWKWNSAGQCSTWLGGGCMIVDGAAPEHRMVLFKASDATFHDTWHTTGLRGTGSGDMAVTNLVVPSARAVSLTDDRPRIDRPLYAFPIFGLLAVGIAAVASGNAEGALADFKTMASARRQPNGRTLAERGSIGAVYAEALAGHASARAFLHDEVAAAWREAETGAPLTFERRARLRLAATHMTRTAADIVRRLQDHAGGAGVFLADPLQRRLADAQTMTAHLMVAPQTHELTGGALLGAPLSAAAAKQM